MFVKVRFSRFADAGSVGVASCSERRCFRFAVDASSTVRNEFVAPSLKKLGASTGRGWSCSVVFSCDSAVVCCREFAMSDACASATWSFTC